jgi:hypothetical protein
VSAADAEFRTGGFSDRGSGRSWLSNGSLSRRGDAQLLGDPAIREFRRVGPARRANHLKRDATVYGFEFELKLRAAVALNFEFHRGVGFPGETIVSCQKKSRMKHRRPLRTVVSYYG